MSAALPAGMVRTATHPPNHESRLRPDVEGPTPMTIQAVNGRVVWSMTPARARKVAALLRRYSNATSEATRLETKADEAEDA